MEAESASRHIDVMIASLASTSRTEQMAVVRKYLCRLGEMPCEKCFGMNGGEVFENSEQCEEEVHAPRHTDVIKTHTYRLSSKHTVTKRQTHGKITGDKLRSFRNFKCETRRSV